MRGVQAAGRAELAEVGKRTTPPPLALLAAGGKRTAALQLAAFVYLAWESKRTAWRLAAFAFLAS